jgi:hypothetical protein
MRQEACKFEASLGYIARPCIKKSKEKNNCQKTLKRTSSEKWSLSQSLKHYPKP